MADYRPSFTNALQNIGVDADHFKRRSAVGSQRHFITAVSKNMRFVLGGIIVLGGVLYAARSYAAVPQGNLVNANGACLQVDEDSGLSLQTCSTEATQTWQAADDGTVRNADKCLDVATMKGPALPVAYVAGCDGSQSQQWKIDEAAKQVKTADGKCLHDVFKGQGANSRLVAAVCRDTEQQQWTLREAGAVQPPAANTDNTAQDKQKEKTETVATPPASATPSTAPAAPGGASPSGVAVPVGDLQGWKQVFYDDFTKDAALGSWGSECDGNATVYTGAQGQQWKSYPKCYKDTYQKRPYRADQILSVKGGMLNFYLHSVDGQPAGANPSPVLNGGTQYQTYGRYVARFKVDTPSLKEYHIAWLLWPQSGEWPSGGEEDFPEGSLAESVGGFHHYSGGGACQGCQDAASSDFKYTDWHTYTMEWMPGHVRYLADDKVVLDTTKWVPDNPMRWQLQTETNGNGNNAGNLMVDWVAVYSYQK
jgi:hypothetical protein